MPLRKVLDVQGMHVLNIYEKYKKYIKCKNFKSQENILLHSTFYDLPLKSKQTRTALKWHTHKQQKEIIQFAFLYATITIKEKEPIILRGYLEGVWRKGMRRERRGQWDVILFPFKTF